MQVIKRIIVLLVFFILPSVIFAQSTYFSQGDKAYEILNRLEIKDCGNADVNFSTIKPYNRKYAIEHIEKLYSDSAGKSINQSLNLSVIDLYNLRSVLMNNQELVSGITDSFRSKKPILKNFYVSKPNLYEVNIKDFYLTINPILSYQKSSGSALDKGVYINSRGVIIRGMISKTIGFYSTITDNQEMGPAYFNERVNNFHAVPGVGFYKSFKNTAFDYFDARGYITFKAAKRIDVQFGYDNNFIGNGYRSLFLSDFANSYLFLKLNARFKKFNYQSLFTELIPPYLISGDNLLDKKYATFHHLTMNVTNWLNIGLFEGVVFGKKNTFNIKYLNPVIFSRHIEGFSNGSPDNALAGIDMKANFAHQFQFYVQLMMDEFDLSKKNGYWANKTGYQLGIKYIDALTINNFDLQFETNKVRPFTYAFNNPIAAYTHYNLPLAHPLGANFQEFIGIAKYQPLPKWRVMARLIYYNQGLDSLRNNFGSNPFENTFTRHKDFGNRILGGNKASCLNSNINISYEIRENFFIETTLLYRKYKTQLSPASITSKLIFIGVRWNIFKREYDL